MTTESEGITHWPSRFPCHSAAASLGNGPHPVFPMAQLFFITHPEVDIDPASPVARWHLSAAGRSRIDAYARGPEVAEVRAVWSSTEAKALEGAEILAGVLHVSQQSDEALGENDRSSTGYVVPAEFSILVEAFFGKPEESVQGWERAVDAQARIVAAVRSATAASLPGDLAIVSHGGVGALLLAHALNRSISRAHDQPFQGHRMVLDRDTLEFVEGWKPLPASNVLAGEAA